MAKRSEVKFTDECPSWIKDRLNAAHVVMGADVARIAAFLESLPLLDGNGGLLFHGNGYSVQWGLGDDEDGTVDFVNVYRTTPLADGRRLLANRPAACLIAHPVAA